MYLSLFFIVIIGYLVVERIRHERRLKRIRIRIHVNGTRGKSSVTRLIAASLRKSGIRTLGKTTGSEPQLILPDGTSETVQRRGPANIIEQLDVVRRADTLGVDAIVIECMALDPVLQFVSETKLIRSSIGVITNVRPDHFEVMGDNLDAIALALSRSIPQDGALITADARYYQLFASLASPMNSKVILANSTETSIAETFPDYLIFVENVSIAQQVCTQVGVNPAVVIACLADECSAQNSVLSKRFIGEKTIYFIDAFAANDIHSTQVIQEWACTRMNCPRPWIALYNNRSDRPLRMRSFAGFLQDATSYDYVAIIGDGISLATKHFRNTVSGDRLLPLADTTPERITAELLEHLPYPEFTIIGMGNEKGSGQLVSRYLRGV